MRGPAKVAERRRPELRGSHCDRKRLGSSRTLKETFRRNGGRETVERTGPAGKKRTMHLIECNWLTVVLSGSRGPGKGNWGVVCVVETCDGGEGRLKVTKVWQCNAPVNSKAATKSWHSVQTRRPFTYSSIFMTTPVHPSFDFQFPLLILRRRSFAPLRGSL